MQPLLLAVRVPHWPQQGCVEFTKVGNIIAVRDSVLGTESPILQFDEVEITASLAEARDGEIDHLI